MGRFFSDPLKFFPEFSKKKNLVYFFELCEFSRNFFGYFRLIFLVTLQKKKKYLLAFPEFCSGSSVFLFLRNLCALPFMDMKNCIFTKHPNIQ